jgi:hypothetical protein
MPSVNTSRRHATGPETDYTCLRAFDRTKGPMNPDTPGNKGPMS